jgi:hypothetical protein
MNCALFFGVLINNVALTVLQNSVDCMNIYSDIVK